MQLCIGDYEHLTVCNCVLVTTSTSLYAAMPSFDYEHLIVCSFAFLTSSTSLYAAIERDIGLPFDNPTMEDGKLHGVERRVTFGNNFQHIELDDVESRQNFRFRKFICSII